MTFKDHFSGHADLYRQYRPSYPEELFEQLARAAEGRALAWDVATGNGQAALGLVRHFDAVVASDASAQQIDNATPHSKIRYLVAPAESTPLEAGSVDLVTVAQAAHWFDLERFYAEVRRTTRPGGVIALWTYFLHLTTPAVDTVVERFYREVVGPYWPPERLTVVAQYRELVFPFERVPLPEFEMTETWSLHQMLGYLRSWSATQRFVADRGTDPIELVDAELKSAWGDPDLPRAMRWPMTVLAGRV